MDSTPIQSPQEVNPPPREMPKANTQVLAHFLKAFLVPTLIGKSFILYFGLRYSEFPDEGYGYGLVVAIAITVGNLGRLVWKYRHVEDL